jgi:pyruvate-ferredoxin/flavodoxin oxidoreductase
MKKFSEISGRNYAPVSYFGHPEAENVIVIMGSGVETVIPTSEFFNKNGEKTGVLKISLFRPFPNEDFISVLPKSVKKSPF